MSDTKYLAFDCDDVHPGNFPFVHLKVLAEKGFKPTLFIPAWWHGEYNLIDHKEWVEKMKEIGEIQAHGLLHRGPHNDCEFYTKPEHIEATLKAMMNIYEKVGIHPTVLRPPGWLYKDFPYEKYVKHLSKHESVDTSIQVINIHKLVEPKGEYVLVHSHAEGGQNENDLSNPEIFKKLLDWLSLYSSSYTYITVGEMYDKAHP